MRVSFFAGRGKPARALFASLWCCGIDAGVAKGWAAAHPPLLDWPGRPFVAAVAGPGAAVGQLVVVVVRLLV